MTSLPNTSRHQAEETLTDAELVRMDECGLPEPDPQIRFESLQLERRGVTPDISDSKAWQRNLWQKETLWRDSICARLREAKHHEIAEKLEACHQEKSVRICTNCKTPRYFWNRCELKFCPICAERLAKERRETVEWWTRSIRQPKHLVLTARNTHDLSREYLRWFKHQFAKLRARKVCANWRGGFYSIEVTWKSEGAHVHLHALVDTNWVDTTELAKVWGKLMGQDFAIVKVKDARGEDYLKEVTKYVVKGSELATWSAQRVATFIGAIQDVRMFGVFGTLFARRAELRDFLDDIRSCRNVCQCGCKSFQIHDAEHWEATEEIRISELDLPPPKAPTAQAAQLNLTIHTFNFAGY